MQDAHYWRAQADLCLNMARKVSDKKAAESLRAQAAEFHSKAQNLEAGGSNGSLSEPARDAPHAE
jgi:hypothetical protein